MKTRAIIFYVAAFLFLVPANADAQVLKKIGRAVKEAAKAALSTGDDHSESDANTNGEATTNKHTERDNENEEELFDYEKHAVSLTDAGTASYRAGEYFMEPYSSIRVQDGQLASTVVVGVMTQAEQLSELGEGSKQDVAILYENGKKSKETTVGALDPTLAFQNTQYDWYFIREEAKGGTDETYVKRNVAKNAYEISFLGKKYGPYTMISSMIVDKTKSRFYALVIPSVKDLEQTKAYLVSNEGTLTPMPYGGELLANRDFSQVCTVVPMSYALGEQLMHENDQTKIKAIQDQLTLSATQSPNKNHITFADGKKLESIYALSPWLNASGSHIFSMNNNGDSGLEAGLYLDGKMISDGMVQRGQAWCNQAGSNWALWGNVKGDPKLYLIFKDGTKVPTPIHPRHLIVEGKEYIAWFTYDPRYTDKIRLCSKAL